MRNLRAIIVLAVLAAPCVAGAADAPGSAADTAPGWIATLGFSAEVATGGDYSVLPSTFDLRRADEPESFGAPDDAFGFSLLDWNGLALGPAADLRFVGHRLAVDGGAYAEYWPIENHLRLRAEALANVGEGEGAHLSLGGDMVLPADGVTVSAGPRLTLGTDRYFRTGADAEAAVPASRRFYAGATAAVKLPVTPAVSTTLYDEYQTPLSGAGRRDGNPENTIGLELDYSFKVGG
ncbi:hypothetical protein GCM10011390_24200 [Aureimonas endophytica]|uniref:Outer membrane protein n=1 Tax=Aureimonas endophytica TaxID=2027858 RepID=A0A917E645_9HYPH|nr:MipA/OmpV family protein [Aureimonas endophytica]GGE04425.1 hypothetical protein GCM10011390_24200 [Aureimonas endophytica]